MKMLFYNFKGWLFVFFLMLSLHVQAATITVTNGNDAGAGSLRQAIADAAAGDVIDFSMVVTTVTLTSDQLFINKNLTINGGSGVTITRDAGAANFRIFNINNVNAIVVFNKLSITNGKDAGQAGGVQNGGTLTLNDCTLANNVAGQGGGLQNDGIMTMNRCFVYNNGSVSGSGLVIYGSTTTLNNCVFTNNRGAYAIDMSSSGTLFITNSTIAKNAIGGINVGRASAAVMLKNTIVAENTVNIFNNVSASSAYNLIGTEGRNGGLTNGTNNNLVGISPMFANSSDPDGADNIFGTADDGLMLTACNLATNVGNNADAPSGKDIAGNTRIFNTTVDIGAYEFQANSGPHPTITLGTIPAILAGATSFTFPYTATTSSPTSYSISGTGITTATDATLPGSPITVNLNPAASGGIIDFTLTVKNANGCTSTATTGSVVVNTPLTGACATATFNGVAPIAPTATTAGVGGKGSLHIYTVPAGVTAIRLDAKGAKGGSSPNHFNNTYVGGRGGSVQATYAVTPGDVLYILVGGKGGDGTLDDGINGRTASGGGGATVVSKGPIGSGTLLLVAGGGGGAGRLGGGGNSNNAPNSGAGFNGAGGASFSANGGNSNTSDDCGKGGQALNAGGYGGANTCFRPETNGGGYGGGGAGNYNTGNGQAGGGGGGGYVGGNAGATAGGNGGSSYNDPSATNVTINNHSEDNGSVVISVAASISYTGSPFCKTLTATAAPTTTGYTGGTFSAIPTGLTIDATTGVINPSTSTAGTYLVSYNTLVGCTAATTTVTVNASPTLTLGTIPAICPGATSFTIPYTSTTGSPTTYSISGTGFTTVTDAVLLSGSITVNLSAGASGTSIPFTLKVKNAIGCISANISESVTLSATPSLTLGTIPAICPEATSFTIPYTATTGTPTSYSISGTGISGVTDAALSSGSITVNLSGGVSGTSIPFTLTVKNASGCTTTSSASVIILSKPTITLTTQNQVMNEGDNQTLCDIDADPVNSLQFTVGSSCVVGSLVWRSQVGNGTWSAWTNQAPISQSTYNQSYRYQAACDANCPITYTRVITVIINSNYRAAVPQNVSLVADGTTVLAGEEKSICDQSGNSLTFNATCAAGEILLYSVDGGVYLPQIPTQIVDGNFHNYRVRCQKSDGTVSCFETESGLMRLKISAIAAAPVASLNVTSGCGTSSSFSGTANCGSLTTVWYNATTNVALPNLPNTTPNETTSYYARCQNTASAGEAGCQSGVSNTVTFTVVPVNTAPTITVSSDLVCTGVLVTVSANCPAGSKAFWNTGVSENSFSVSFNNVTTQGYSARCIFEIGCQSPVSELKTVRWKAFELTIINIGQSKSAIKTNDRAAWASQFVTADGGPNLDNSTEINPTLYFTENANKTGPRYWTIHADACALGTNGSLTFDMLASPEGGVQRSFNTHENNAPYFMYANRDGYTELYAQNHPAYGFYEDNGSGGNVYDAGLPKGLYKLGIRYWDQKGQGSIYPSTRQAAGKVLAYQEYWFRIQSKDGVGTGAARVASDNNLSSRRDLNPLTFAEVAPNPVATVLRLKVSDAKGQQVKTILMDASGRELLSHSFTPETNQHQEEFEVSELTNGMYFLKVNAGDKQATLKVVKVQ